MLQNNSLINRPPTIQTGISFWYAQQWLCNNQRAADQTFREEGHLEDNNVHKTTRPSQCQTINPLHPLATPCAQAARAKGRSCCPADTVCARLALSCASRSSGRTSQAVRSAMAVSYWTACWRDCSTRCLKGSRAGWETPWRAQRRQRMEICADSTERDWLSTVWRTRNWSVISVRARNTKITSAAP